MEPRRHLRRWLSSAIAALAIAQTAIPVRLAAQPPVTGPDPFAGLTTGEWIAAVDSTRVRAEGAWWSTRFRYAWMPHRVSFEDGATLELEIEGRGLALRLGAHATPSYGTPNRGRLHVEVDGVAVGVIRPLDEDREVLLPLGQATAAGDEDRSYGDAQPSPRHTVRLVHRGDEGGGGVRVEGLYVLREPAGSLTFHVGGEDVAQLVDVRARLMHGDVLVRDALVRNWQTGLCRLVGMPPGDGYTLEVSAVGWRPQRVDDIRIAAGRDTTLPMVYLEREPRTGGYGMRFPTTGHPVVRQAGDTLRTRAIVYQNPVASLTLRRVVGPAVISRTLAVREDTAAAYYYDHEYVAALPDDMPPGLYDLVATVRAGESSYELHSPRSVHVVDELPVAPVFLTFGHLDTWGQYQAEYLRRVAELADIVGPDMVLVSNEVSAAYASGSLVDLHVPYVITFGNHQVEGHEGWYGDAVGIVDFGRALAVLNYGRYWHEDLSRADALLAARHDTRLKVINAIEPNAPVESFLDAHRVAYIHDAHGPGERVMVMGATPTQRAGKTDSESFRLVRFDDGRVASVTYHGDPQAPFRFPRAAPPPLRIDYDGANDGSRGAVTATITNDYLDPLPNCRAVFVLPHGEVAVQGGRLERAVSSDDGAFTVATIRCDVPAAGAARITAVSR